MADAYSMRNNIKAKESSIRAQYCKAESLRPSVQALAAMDERLGLGQLIRENLTDARRGKNTHLPLSDLLRQAVSKQDLARTPLPRGRRPRLSLVKRLLPGRETGRYKHGIRRDGVSSRARNLYHDNGQRTVCKSAG